MRTSWLDNLRCPFCGTRLALVDTGATVGDDRVIMEGVLGCECCAFPIVAGIPVLIADDATRAAMHALEAGRRQDALLALLDLDGGRAEQFLALQARGAAATYRDALDILSTDAEARCFLYRFSDPTFRPAEALVRSVTLDAGLSNKPILDLCGGSGHLTRTLAGRTLTRDASPATVIADLHFWKLWLATMFTSPTADAVCCNADAPLPFVSELFSMVVLMDAFPYIWHKRLCADEMSRVASPDGVLVLPHLHSALGENFSAGDTLSPTAYQALFAARCPRLFSDTRLFEDLVEEGVVDLTADVSPDALGHASSLTLVASRQDDVFRHRHTTRDLELTGTLTINPLYAVTQEPGRSVLTLQFPTPEYAEEFAECRRYLPDEVVVDADLTNPLMPDLFGHAYEDLRRRRVLLDAPPRYC
ncbi:MAG: methyltransferase domain-containing protein [Acidobacteria bacterium]|nr:methyltransferase domain-containing protein [Acidobacteriota bacterium]